VDLGGEGEGQLDWTTLVEIAVAIAAEEEDGKRLAGSAGLPDAPSREALGFELTFRPWAGRMHPSGPTAPAPLALAGAVDWPSKSVVQLEAFLRSRGVVLGAACDKATLVEAATAIAAEEEEEARPGRGHRDGKRILVGVWSLA
jgi:hypothetical protein